MSAVPPRFTLNRARHELILRVGDAAHSLGTYPPATPNDTILLWRRIFDRGVATGIGQTTAAVAGPYGRYGANIVRETGGRPASIATASDVRVAVLLVRLLNDFAEKHPVEEREYIA